MLHASIVGVCCLNDQEVDAGIQGHVNGTPRSMVTMTDIYHVACMVSHYASAKFSSEDSSPVESRAGVGGKTETLQTLRKLTTVLGRWRDRRKFRDDLRYISTVSTAK